MVTREDARFLWKRTPPAMKRNAELQRTFELLQRLWNKDYQVLISYILHTDSAIGGALPLIASPYSLGLAAGKLSDDSLAYEAYIEAR